MMSAMGSNGTAPLPATLAFSGLAKAAADGLRGLRWSLCCWPLGDRAGDTLGDVGGGRAAAAAARRGFGHWSPFSSMYLCGGRYGFVLS